MRLDSLNFQYLSSNVIFAVVPREALYATEKEIREGREPNIDALLPPGPKKMNMYTPTHSRMFNGYAVELADRTRDVNFNTHIVLVIKMLEWRGLVKYRPQILTEPKEIKANIQTLTTSKN